MLNFKKRFSSLKKGTNNNGQDSGFPPNIVFKSGASSINATEVDNLFFGVLLGATSQVDRELNDFEKTALQQLNSLVQKNQQASKLIPRLPSVLPKVIQALREEDASADQISGLIEQDHILVGEVMRLVNSPYYRTRQEITSLKQATVMLGREGLRQLVASAIVRPLMIANSGHFVKLSSKMLWEHSEKTAMAIVKQCSEGEEQRFYAYLAGILQNIGFTVGFTVLDSIFDGTQAPNSKLFLQQFVVLCRELSAAIATSWILPSQISDTFITMAHPLDHPEVSSLETTLFITDRMVKAQILGSRINFAPSSARILINGKPCESCLKTLESINLK